MTDESLSIDYVGESTLSILPGLLFAEECQIYNGRALDAAKVIGIEPQIQVGDSLGEVIETFTEATDPVVEKYEEIVGSRTEMPIRLEVDQFFNWLYQERDELFEDASTVVVEMGVPAIPDEPLALDEELLDKAVEHVLRPAVEDGIFEEGGAEHYVRTQILPEAQPNLTTEALADDPAGAVRKALNAHVNLMAWRELDDAKTLIEESDPNADRDHIDDLLRGDDPVVDRIRRALEWGATRRRRTTSTARWRATSGRCTPPPRTPFVNRRSTARPPPLCWGRTGWCRRRTRPSGSSTPPASTATCSGTCDAATTFPSPT
jgi:hypothetical protein